jgi:hypothetical protein
MTLGQRRITSLRIRDWRRGSGRSGSTRTWESTPVSAVSSSTSFSNSASSISLAVSTRGRREAGRRICSSPPLRDSTPGRLASSAARCSLAVPSASLLLRPSPRPGMRPRRRRRTMNSASPRKRQGVTRGRSGNNR